MDFHNFFFNDEIPFRFFICLCLNKRCFHFRRQLKCFSESGISLCRCAAVSAVEQCRFFTSAVQQSRFFASAVQQSCLFASAVQQSRFFASAIQQCCRFTSSVIRRCLLCCVKLHCMFSSFRICRMVNLFCVRRAVCLVRLAACCADITGGHPSAWRRIKV